MPSFEECKDIIIVGAGKAKHFSKTCHLIIC